MNIAVLGTGYVGLVSGVCLASIGHTVVGIDIDAEKVARLQAGVPGIFERGLEDLLRTELESHRIRFVSDVRQVSDADIVLIAVGTPQGESGEADLSAVFAVVQAAASFLKFESIIVTKSTVPVGTGDAIAKILSDAGRSDVQVGSNPEFLRQGYAVEDFLHPDRIVVGASDDALERIVEMYAPIISRGVPLIRTDITTAELVKYAANTFLATKLAYVNEMADLCEVVGASIGDVTHAVGLDSRISPSFMAAGPGFGGSCLPKDTEALLHTFSSSGARSRILAAAIDSNRDRRSSLASRVVDAIEYKPKQIAVWGLTFKADTDDLRDSPAIDLIHGLSGMGISTTVYDPLVSELPNDLGATLSESALAAATGADAVVVVTEWPEFRDIDLDSLRAVMRGATIVDFRSVLSSDAVNAAGLDHHSIGNPPSIARGLHRSPQLVT